MRSTSASTPEGASVSPVQAADAGRWLRCNEDADESRATEPEPRILKGLGRLAEPPVGQSMDVIERVASLLRMGSIRTW